MAEKAQIVTYGSGSGSKSPIRRINESTSRRVYITMLDGRVKPPIEVLLEKNGDWEIAAEQAQMSVSEFARMVAMDDPEEVAIGMQALTFMTVSSLNQLLNTRIRELVEAGEVSTNQMIGLHVELSKMLPKLVPARVGGNNVDSFLNKFKPDLREAVEALLSSV